MRPDVAAWVMEEIRARNAAIQDALGQRHSCLSFSIILMGGFLAFLGSSQFTSTGNWRAAISFGITILLGSLWSRYQNLFWDEADNAEYIREELVPRLAKLYGCSGETIYGWETHRAQGPEREPLYWWVYGMARESFFSVSIAGGLSLGAYFLVSSTAVSSPGFAIACLLGATAIGICIAIFALILRTGRHNKSGRFMPSRSEEAEDSGSELNS
jgi:hypothetical protein